MNKVKKKTEFDCLEYKDKVQEQIYKEIKDLTWKEEIEYFNSKARNGSFSNAYQLFIKENTTS